MSDTFLDHLIARLAEARAFNANAHVAPVALLWPDEGRQWLPVLGRLRERLPIVSLGAYDRAIVQGPAYWVRCVVAGTIDAGLQPGLPIVYLPGVPRSALRAADDCHPELAPMAELQYRSEWFTHPNGKDWTVRAWLANADRGMGLPVADGAEMSAVIPLALNRLVDVTAAELASETLDADYFRALINPDPVRSILHWIEDPAAFRQRLTPAEWTAFIAQCRSKYDLNPETAGEITGAERLALRHGKWAEVWQRFVETPERYPGIPNRLRRAKPLELFVAKDEAWPQDNEDAEAELRGALTALAHETAASVRTRITHLEAEHAVRRGTVWATLGQAPLARALEHLASLAERSVPPLFGSDIDTLQAAYADGGWRVDDALVRALGAATNAADRASVAGAARTLYRPWLEQGALALQLAIVSPDGAERPPLAPPATTDKGVVTAFIDGLRLDVAHRLHDRLGDSGLLSTLDVCLAALPTVTPTTKPALVPIAPDMLVAGPDFYAARKATGAKANSQVLRSLMAENGVQVLGARECGDPSGSAWTEAGEFDHRGHDLGIRLVDHLDADLDGVVARIRELLDTGWQRVDVITDHGWILLPGAMEKVELPVATTEAKKGRCARLKPGAVVAVPTVPWLWDREVRIALAPGATCFEAGKEYEHGGVSPQECFIPRLRVTAGTGTHAVAHVEITAVHWNRLLCRVDFAGADPDTRIDLRTLPGDPSSSLVEEVKPIAGTGRATLAVPDEDREGERCFVVFVDRDDQVIAQRPITVGSNR